MNDYNSINQQVNMKTATTNTRSLMAILHDLRDVRKLVQHLSTIHKIQTRITQEINTEYQRLSALLMVKSDPILADDVMCLLEEYSSASEILETITSNLESATITMVVLQAELDSLTHQGTKSVTYSSSH